MRGGANRIDWDGGSLHCLLDGAVAFGRDLFPDPRGAVLPETITLPVQAYLLCRDAMAPVLIDTGSGGAEAGVAHGLRALGIDPGAVGTVIFTHLHGDHRGGYLAQGYDGARVCLSEAEAEYWAGQDHPARQVLEWAAGRTVLLQDGDEPVPGVRVWALPGHMGLVIDRRIAVLGDILHRADLQLADPELSTRFDVDPALACVTRKAALARTAAKGLVVCGGHMRLPGQEQDPQGAAFLRLAAKGKGWGGAGRMTPGARASAAIEILDRILAGTPGEQALTNWGRGARYAGSTDRAEVRDIVFQCLRCRSSYTARGGGLTGRGLVLGFLRSLPDDQAHGFFAGGPHDPAPPDPVTETGRAPLGAEVHDIPDWLEPLLRQSLGDDFSPILRAMQSRAPVYLRVNPAKATLTQVITLLQAEQITTRPCAKVPNALQVTGGERRVKSSKPFADGVVELQDLSSQAVVAALPLADGMRVLDHCAGGGGKTLAMAARARLGLFAHDIAPRRMADLPARAQRAGVKVTQIDSPETAAPYDLVLVDAPCSGSGSWRRDPEGKWRLNQARLADLTATQAAILDRTAAMVAPGGVLAYVTCSLLCVENQDQVTRFLARHPGWRADGQTTLTPLTHSDGFFLAILRPQGG